MNLDAPMFPVLNDSAFEHREGISRRDYYRMEFAKAAMQAFANERVESIEEMTALCFHLADAMLKEAEK